MIPPRMNPEDHLQVALRPWAPPTSWEPNHAPIRTSRAAGIGRRYRQTPRAQLTLVFDTETTTDATQRMIVGSWRLYRDLPGREHPSFLVEEGIVIPDELEHLDPDAYLRMRDYVRTHRADSTRAAYRDLSLLTRSQFVERLLWRRAYKQRALVVGFNLPFDLTRLAVGVGEAKGWFHGGFSLPLSTYRGGENRYRPRILVRMIDSKRAEISFSRPAGIDLADQVPDDSLDGHPDRKWSFRGRFLDLRTLAFALTNTGHSLESASKAFGAPYEKRVVEHGTVTAELIDYCREDVAATAALCRSALAEYRRHPIKREATKARSPASIAKGYLEEMGLLPPLSLGDLERPD